MTRSPVAMALLAMLYFWGYSSAAQSVDDMNLQVHGYATQAFVYSTNDNWNTMDTTNGSTGWTEAVLNISAQPEPRLRIGVQGRYFLLGYLANAFTLDWAQADYKVNEYVGFRAGKVKTPSGLFNESQDIDPAQIWILLPQSIYPLASRNSILSHYGGVFYGQVALGERFGKLEYRSFGGQVIIGPNDGYFQSFRDAGLSAPNGVTTPMVGQTLRWTTPVEGLMVGATDSAQTVSATIVAGGDQGSFHSSRFFVPRVFGKYEKNRLMLGGEYERQAVSTTIAFPGAPPPYSAIDQRTFYAMGSYKISGKLTGGLYYSSSIDHKAAMTSARYQKDWAISARYDVSPFLYLKAEQHVIDGTEIGFSTSDNTGGLKPNTSMTLLKLGVSF